MASRDIPFLRPGLIVGLAVACAAMAGLLMGRNPGIGVGFTLAVLYGPLVLLNVAAGIALWIPLGFVRYLPFVWIGPNATLLLILFAWLGSYRSLAPTIARLGRRHRRALVALVLLLVWLTLSMTWARDVSQVATNFWTWIAAALAMIVVATTLRTRREITWVTWAYVLGATLSVAVGLALTGLHPAASALDSAAATEGRLSGGLGDPNYLALGLTPAIFLGGALAIGTRNAAARITLAIAMAIIAVGLAATQSRGGFLALLTAVVLAPLVLRGQRRKVVALLVPLLAISAFWLVATPGALDRVTSTDGGGSGRSDLWRVAWQVAADHPVVGVGLNNFEVVSPEYVRRPGTLRKVALIADRPHLVHNVYLQLLAETGIVGLVLFLVVVIACVRAAWQASRSFDRSGDRRFATLSGAVMVGQIGGLVALFFVSDGPDVLLWMLLGLGPAALSVATTPTGGRTA